MAPADLDSDGKLDLLARWGLLMQRQQGFEAHLRPEWQGFGVGAGDFNGDGRIDLLLQSALPQEVHVHLGDGSGQFGDPVTTTIASRTAVHAADLDGDGLDDLIGIEESFLGPVRSWTADGAGSFTSGVSLPLSAFRALPGDVDGDGMPEIVAATVTDGIQIEWNDGGNFLAAEPWTSPGIYSVELAQMNGDEGLELLVPADFAQDTTIRRIFVVSPARGSAEWPSLRYSMEDGPLEGLAAADLNADGLVDLILTRLDGGTKSRVLEVLCATPDRAFTPCFGVPLAQPVTSIHPLQADEDEWIDLVVAGEAGIWALYADP